jgi:hypothetical protein
VQGGGVDEASAPIARPVTWIDPGVHDEIVDPRVRRRVQSASQAIESLGVLEVDAVDDRDALDGAETAAVLAAGGGDAEAAGPELPDELEADAAVGADDQGVAWVRHARDFLGGRVCAGVAPRLGLEATG